MSRFRRAGSRGDFGRLYEAYARDHGMSKEQMLAHDRKCCPDSILKPYLLWLCAQRFSWTSTQSKVLSESTGTEAEFEQWLDQQTPHSDAFTCECHVKLFFGATLDGL